MILERVGVALAVLALLVGACSSPGSPAADPVTVAPSTGQTPTPGLPVPSVSIAPGVLPSGYAEPCRMVAALATQWVDLAVRIGEAQTAQGIDRQEVDDLLGRLLAVRPLLPADIAQLVPRLTDPLTTVRGMLETGVSGPVEFGEGRAAVLEILDGCDAYVPNYDDGPGGVGG